jgi:ligand-binding sensor domain-containing protein/serine phosphatase RsbU (regulator of sigma subunit)
MRSAVLASAAPAILAAALWTRDARALDPAKSPEQYVAHLWQQTAGGLPQNFVPALAQTRDGYLWLGTQEGVVRFDGGRFVVFSRGTTPELGINDIAALAADSKGGLWIGTRGAGLVHYEDGRFTPYGKKDGLPHDVVTAVFEARDGTIWAGTRGGGAAMLKDGHFTALRGADGLAGDTVNVIAEGPDGAMWFGTDSGLSRYQGGRFTTIKAGLSSLTINALLADPDGVVWIGTLGGLDRWQDGALASSVVAGTVHALLRDTNGNLWIGAASGLERLSRRPTEGGISTPFGTVTKLEGDGVHRYEAASLLEDREGNVWLGMESVGFLRLQDGKVTTFGSGLIWTTFVDAADTLWLGSDPGAFVIHGDKVSAVPGTSQYSYIGFAQGPGDAVWIGSVSHGLFSYDKGKLTAVEGAVPGEGVGIRSILTDSHGTLWFGTNYGLSRLQGGKITHFHPADGVPDVAMRAIAEGPDGSIWVGASAALLRYKDGKFTIDGAKEGIPDAPVESLYVDGDDLWIGTYDAGLLLRRDGKITRVTTREGLFNDVIYAIVDDRRGDLWMSCNRGVFHASKAELVAVATGAKKELTSSALGTSDGMRSAECNSGVPGGVRTKDGLLWFATSEGAVRIDPAHMRKNTVVPPVHIEEARVDHQHVDVEHLGELAAGSRDFEFSYTAVSFTAPERVQFKYKLEGFDKDWVDAGPRRVAYYTNLAPGRYELRVIAANDDGVWNDAGASAGFVLLPHFYQTLWFRLAGALALVFAGAGTVPLRLRALRKRAEELEAKVDERTLELAKANKKLEVTYDALAEKDALLHEDLLQAKAFQERILPKLPSGGSMRFRAVYRPADLVGGDIYDVCELESGHYRVFLADTTGHGVQASLRTMVLKTEYERVKLSKEGPARVLSLLNHKLATVYPDLAMRCSACCFDVLRDGDGVSIRYANAAHPPLLRVDGAKVGEVYTSATFLGVLADAVFPEIESRLATTEQIVAYTDGICEQEDGAGNPFGVERMERLLATHPRSADEVVRDLDRALTEFAGGKPLGDDVVLLCIECAGERRSLVSVSSAPSAKPA